MPLRRCCAMSPIDSTMPATMEAASTPALLFHRNGRVLSAGHCVVLLEGDLVGLLEDPAVAVLHVPTARLVPGPSYTTPADLARHRRRLSPGRRLRRHRRESWRRPCSRPALPPAPRRRFRQLYSSDSSFFGSWLHGCMSRRDLYTGDVCRPTEEVELVLMMWADWRPGGEVPTSRHFSDASRVPICKSVCAHSA